MLYGDDVGPRPRRRDTRLMRVMLRAKLRAIFANALGAPIEEVGVLVEELERLKVFSNNLAPSRAKTPAAAPAVLPGAPPASPWSAPPSCGILRPSVCPPFY